MSCNRGLSRPCFFRVFVWTLCLSSQVRPGVTSGGCIPRPSACVLVNIKFPYWKSYSDQMLPLVFLEIGHVNFPGNLFSHGQEGREEEGKQEEGINISCQTLRCHWSQAKAPETSFHCFPLLRLLTTVVPCTQLNNKLQTLFIVLVYWAFTTPSLCRYVLAQITFK